MAPLTDWTLTLRQALPRTGSLLRQLRPTLHIPDVLSLRPELFESLGVRGLIWDVDGTLMPSHAPAMDPECQGVFQRLVDAPSLRHVILSNSGEPRFAELGAIFPTIPVIRAYRTENGVSYRRLLAGTESWSGASSTARGGSMIKKPHPLLIDFALGELGLGERAQAMMVGDQYFTDVAGANLGGIRSIKVQTLSPESFALPVRLFQRVESRIFRLLHGRPVMHRLST
jgi:predicted HAD superfamily phosphohydrolase YqeG